MARSPGDPTTLREDAASPITVVRAGQVPYLTAWDWQRDLAARRAAGEMGDVLLLLDHPRVYTMGRRANDDNLVFDEEERARRGIELHWIDRGGDVTYHGPGQLVGYPIFRLAGPRVVDHVRALEEINLRTAASYGIQAQRVDGFSGVWVGNAKLTAIGVHVSAGYVTTHGWATNVTTDLSDFEGIVPCGIEDPDRTVASLASLGAHADIDGVIERTEQAVTDVLGAEVHHADLASVGLVTKVA